MGTKYAHPDLLDNGLNHLKNNATKILLISSYVAGDSYATVVAAKLAEAALAPGDFTVADNGTGRKVTSAAKAANATATVAAGQDLHFAFTDGAAKVLYVTDETTDMAITAGNPVNFPTLTYNSGQPG